MSTKVKDGLFIGDSDSAQDSEFMELNGIEFVVNLTSQFVQNIFELDHVRYVTSRQAFRASVCRLSVCLSVCSLLLIRDALLHTVLVFCVDICRMQWMTCRMNLSLICTERC